MRVLDVIEPKERREAAGLLVSSVAGEVDDESISALTGGGSALVFRVQGKALDCVLRVCSSALCDAAFEVRVQRAASDAGSSPTVLAFDENHGLLIMDNIRSRPLFAEFDAEERRALLVSALRRSHARMAARGEVARGTPELLGFAAGLLGDLKIPWPALASEVYESLGDRAGNEALADAQPCHNDFHPGNVIFDGTSLKVIDWENAGRNDPLYDVATAANAFEFETDGAGALLESYLGRRPDGAELKRFRRLRAASFTFYALCTLYGTAKQLGSIISSEENAVPPFLEIRTGGNGRFDLRRPETRQSLALSMLIEARNLLRSAA